MDVATAVLRREDVRGGEVAFAASWGGATVALLAAEDRVLAPRVSAVGGVAPWTAAPNALRLATTGSLENGSPEAYKAPPHPLARLEPLSPLVARALLEAKVELATASHDQFAPPSESDALARAIRSWSTNAWLVRALRAAG